MSSAISYHEAHRRASLFLTSQLSNECFDQLTLQGISMISCQPGQVVCQLHVGPQLQNRYGTLHGGAVATLVDVVGTLALVTQSNRSGVSLAINSLYLNPMPGGEDVEADARVVKLGRDIGTVEVILRRVNTGELVAQGTHVKKLVSSSDMSAIFESGLVDHEQPKQPATLHRQQQQQKGPRSKL